MTYVYIIESVYNRKEHYIGLAGNLKIRLRDHNSGKSSHTARYKPWQLVCYFAFANEKKARDFENYLKSGSGKSFMKRRFI